MSAVFPLQIPPADPLGQLLVGLVILAVVVLVGRLVLYVTWRLVIVAAVVAAVLYVAAVIGVV